MFRLSTCRLLQTVRTTAISQRGRATVSADTVNHRKLKSIKDIPGPGGVYRLPIIGFALLLQPFSKFSKFRINELINDLYKKYGPIFKVEFAGQQTVFICDTEDIDKVLKLEGNYPYRTPIPIFEVYCKRRGQPKGLGVLNGEEWGNLRKPAQYNVLRPSTVQRYIPLMTEVADDFMDILAAKPYIPNIKNEIMPYGLESAGYLAFNRRIGCLGAQKNEFTDKYDKMFHALGISLFSPPTFKYFRTKLYREFEEAADYLYDYVHAEVKNAHESLLEAQKRGDFDPETDVHLLHQLLSDKRMTSPEQVKGVIIDLFLAGGETTSSAITFLLYNLATNKHVQDKLHEEICKVLTPDGALTEASLKQMSYVKACVKESFRVVFPLMRGLERKTEEDVVVRDYFIPKHTNVVVAMNMVMTRNPKIFQDPDSFLPERWLRGHESKVKHPYAMLPFGFGARSCLGQRFAEQEIYIFLIKLMKKFEVSLPDPNKKYDIDYKPFPDTTEPVEICLTAR